jgi:hypothetical protein
LIYNFIFVNCFRFIIDPNKVKKEYCIYKNIQEGEVLHLSFIITGGHYYDKCNTFLYDGQGKLIFEKYSEMKGVLDELEVTKSGLFKLCFLPLSNSFIYLNIDFHTLSEIGVSKTLANDGK